MDLINKIYLTSSKQASKQPYFILVATNYFTKWVEVMPLKVIDQQVMIKFIKKNLIHRFSLPEFIMTDQDTMFTREEMKEFDKDYGFKLLYSTPYYTQTNGQAKATNKSLIHNI